MLLLLVSAMLIYRGASDASAAVALDERTVLVADDENNVLRAYAIDGGLPLYRHDLAAFLGTATKHPEADIEGAARVGDRVYWITSHGRNPDGKWRSNRHRFFATRVRLSKEGLVVTGVGRAYQGLAEALAAEAALRELGLAESIGPDQRQHAELAPKNAGLNIEGLAASPDGKQLYIGLRNPQLERPAGAPARAIVIPLLNPASVVEEQARPRFGPPLLWDLGGRGIRGMTHASLEGGFFIVAGPRDDGPGFALYRWSGVSGETPTLVRTLDAEGPEWKPEALVAFPASSRLLAFSDDGTVPVPVARPEQCSENSREDLTCPNKNLRDENSRYFRGRWLEP